jgi:hypothetical protein
MRQDTGKYRYKQLEIYKEILELRHIKIKTLVVNIVNLVFAVFVGYYMYQLQADSVLIWGIEFLFLMLLLINIVLYAQDHDLYNNLKIAMYINTIGVFVIAVSLILIYQTPSIFTGLFLAYAITSIYQEYKVMLISNGALFISGFLLALKFNSIFSVPGNTIVQDTYIVIFLFLFVVLLTLSSFILIKRKTFFYNHLAQIKEAEVRNMNLLMEIEEKRKGSTLDSQEYYKALNAFSEQLSKKIGIDNVFERKIKLLKDLQQYTVLEILERYPDYTQEEVEEMKYLELTVNHKMRNIGIKASKSNDVESNGKVIFSESQFRSFKHFNDERYVRIIAFVVFYVLLKVDKTFLKEMTNEQIKDVLYNSEYFYLIDRDIMEIYLQNDEVFDTIVNDIMKDKWNYETNLRPHTK